MAALAFGGCAPKADGATAVYTDDDCRRVSLIDTVSESEVVGAEDLAYDRATGRIIISAYNRRAAEAAAAARADAVPEGGLYAVGLDALGDDPVVLRVDPLVANDEVADGLRPHGMTIDVARGEVIFINRAYHHADRAWVMTPRLLRLGADGAVSNEGSTVPCAANDVVMSGDAPLISFDHKACDWRGGLEDLLGSRESGVTFAGGGGSFSGVGHANGLVVLESGAVVLAATRDRALFVLEKDGSAFSVQRKIELPGAPDNLTLSPDGTIVVALHPSLPAIGAQRKLGIGRAGTRIVRVDAESGVVTLLYDDPKASLFSAATAAVEIGDSLVAGSALDKGLLVCRRAPL